MKQTRDKTRVKGRREGKGSRSEGGSGAREVGGALEYFPRTNLRLETLLTDETDVFIVKRL